VIDTTAKIPLGKTANDARALLRAAHLSGTRLGLGGMRHPLFPLVVWLFCLRRTRDNGQDRRQRNGDPRAL
jgi:hypothetical protein